MGESLASQGFKLPNLPFTSPRRLAIAAAFTATIASISGQSAAGTDAEQVDLARRLTMPSEALRLGDGSGGRLAMLAAYLEPSKPAWNYAWRAQYRGSNCRGAGGFAGYSLSPSLARWMPAVAIAGESESAWCASSTAGLLSASPSPPTMVEPEPSVWRPLQTARWATPLPGDRGSWFESDEGLRPACARRSVSFLRHGAEADRFPLLDCDGSVDGDAIDHLSVMARPIGIERPSLPLPEQADEAALRGEWLPSIKLVHPRLVWAVQQIANRFPGRTIYIVSGYRTGEHTSQHGDARALDLSVMGVAKERVYKACRSLRDTGCGYYPNHNFVHVDVRALGSGGSYWVDVSQPGEKSEYVSSWPGVEEGRSGRWTTGGD